jgi:hypothetical protein
MQCLAGLLEFFPRGGAVNFYWIRDLRCAIDALTPNFRAAGKS